MMKMKNPCCTLLLVMSGASSYHFQTTNHEMLLGAKFLFLIPFGFGGVWFLVFFFLCVAQVGNLYYF